MKGIMIQGTASDVGKSLLATVFCQLFSEEQVKVTPFKAQNMSRETFVLPNGAEIGRSQAIQAAAAKIAPSVWMNPILIKPNDPPIGTEVILFGKRSDFRLGKHFRESFYEKGIALIEEAVQKLSERFDLLIIEGAGSPVEMNLKEKELANMKIADLLDVPVLLVAPIDRGGLFASIVGTLQLLTKEERRRVQGIIVNKFRGDPSSFHDGVRWIEEKTGVPVLGVIPYIEQQLNRFDFDRESLEYIVNQVKPHLDWPRIQQIIARWREK